MSDKFDWSLEKLPTRLKNILGANNIYNYSQLLVAYDKNMLAHIQGIGLSSRKLIEKMLNKKIKHKIKATNFELEEILDKCMQKSFDHLKIRMIEVLMGVKKELAAQINMNINEMRTVILEQSRILEAMQLTYGPHGVINKISEKIPGFNAVMYELSKKLEGKK